MRMKRHWAKWFRCVNRVVSWLAGSQRDANRWRVIFSPWLSHPYDLQCRRATILNVYVYPQYRRCGIGRRLIETMIEWCRAEGFAAVYLHASKDGRRLL